MDEKACSVRKRVPYMEKALQILQGFPFQTKLEKGLEPSTY